MKLARIHASLTLSFGFVFLASCGDTQTRVVPGPIVQRAIERENGHEQLTLRQQKLLAETSKSLTDSSLDHADYEILQESMNGETAVIVRAKRFDLQSFKNFYEHSKPLTLGSPVEGSQIKLDVFDNTKKDDSLLVIEADSIWIKEGEILSTGGKNLVIVTPRLRLEGCISVSPPDVRLYPPKKGAHLKIFAAIGEFGDQALLQAAGGPAGPKTLQEGEELEKLRQRIKTEVVRWKENPERVIPERIENNREPMEVKALLNLRVKFRQLPPPNVSVQGESLILQEVLAEETTLSADDPLTYWDKTIHNEGGEAGEVEVYVAYKIGVSPYEDRSSGKPFTADPKATFPTHLVPALILAPDVATINLQKKVRTRGIFLYEIIPRFQPPLPGVPFLKRNQQRLDGDFLEPYVLLEPRRFQVVTALDDESQGLASKHWSKFAAVTVDGNEVLKATQNIHYIDFSKFKEAAVAFLPLNQ